MALKQREIRDVDGNVIHSGMSKTLRGFVEWLVADHQSLDRADLRGYDLSRLDLQGMKARGACFDGADLSGAQLQRADLTGSTFRPFKYGDGVTRPARFGGCSAVEAVFDRCDLTEAEFGGARLTYASARHAVLDRAVFSGCALTGASLVHARGSETDFSECSMRNVEMAYSVFVEPDFRGCDLRHNVFSAMDEDRRLTLQRHLPDRTSGATFLSGRYDSKTLFSETVPSLRHDAMVSRYVRGLTATASMLALVGALHCCEPLTEVVSHFLGVQGTPEVALLGAVALLETTNHTVGDWLRERTNDALGSVVERIRRIVHEFEERGASRAELVCAMARGRSMSPLRLALEAKMPEARRRGLWHAVKGFCGELGHVIVCDRRHLALALGTLALHADSGIKLSHDITVVRHHHTAGDASAPLCVRFLCDGRSAAVWDLPGHGHVTVRYDAKGEFEGCWDAKGQPLDASATSLPQLAHDRVAATVALEEAMLADHGLETFRYPRQTHHLRDGRDGSILVQSRSDRSVANPARHADKTQGYHPAIIRPDGSTVSIVKGRLMSDAHDPVCGASPSASGPPLS